MADYMIHQPLKNGGEYSVGTTPDYKLIVLQALGTTLSLTLHDTKSLIADLEIMMERVRRNE